MKYSVVAVGGTFDRFHRGHESLLHTAFANGQHVVIGLTTPTMIQGKMLAPIIDSYGKRSEAVRGFLKKNNYLERSELVPITDPYGPLKRRRDIEAVVVGPRFSKEAVETLKKHIAIIHCPVVKTETGPYLSSTAIRLGQVNRTGSVYHFPNRRLVLSPAIRAFLKKPLGKLVRELPTSFKKPLFLASVGDEVTRMFIAKNIIPDLSVVDFYVQRKKKYISVAGIGFPGKQKLVSVRNPAGVLTPVLARTIKQTIKHVVLSGSKEIIRVIGEEDLAALLCILFAPLTSLVCYGQPHEGLVLVEVTEKKKEEIAKLLTSFTPFPVSATIK